MLCSILRCLSLFMIALASLANAVPADAADKPHEWRMASAFPGSALLLGTLGKKFARRATAISDGSLKITFVEPGTLVRPFEIFDAVRKERVEAGWATSAYWMEKDPAFALFSSVPFGPGPTEYLAWMKYGGGRELRDELYEPFGLVSITCGAMPPEAGGWYRPEIRTVTDFEGLKMRTFGLGAQVLQLFGVEPQLIAPDKLLDALRDRTLDAAKFSVPAIDARVGFDKAGPLFYYFPGWHQQTMLFELLVGQTTWLALTETERRRIETTCEATLADAIAEGETLQMRALLDLRSRGVEVRRFPADVLNRLEKGWQEVAALMAGKSRNFEKIWTSLIRFREEYRVWREHGYYR